MRTLTFCKCCGTQFVVRDEGPQARGYCGASCSSWIPPEEYDPLEPIEPPKQRKPTAFDIFDTSYPLRASDFD